MKIVKNIALELIFPAFIILVLLLSISITQNELPNPQEQLSHLLSNVRETDSGANSAFYGTQFVGIEELAAIKGLGIEVVLRNFAHNGPVDEWLAYLDEAQANDIQVVAWLWPEGWSWDGTEWQIDAQAELFIQSVAGHPALFAVYALHEPYWQGCFGCGYTTAEQQALYDAIKAIADVPVWSAVDSMAGWTARGEETAFADGICDYCETWYYPFKADGTYERDEVIDRLTADLAVAHERGPNSKIVWIMQGFAQGPPSDLRMPTADEMRDLAAMVYGTDVDGAMWYSWNFNGLYTDYLSKHPELHPVMREIYDKYVKPQIFLPIVQRDAQTSVSNPATSTPAIKKLDTEDGASPGPPVTPEPPITAVPSSAFYGTQFVGIEELAAIKGLGIEVVLRNFAHNGPVDEWLAYLDEAQANDIQVVAWLWPEGWSWDGTEWQIDAQAELFIQSVAGHPALFAVYALHEPYWQGCFGCGYTTAEQQALYDAINAIADVPVWSAVDSMSFWTAQDEEMAFADGICDYCETWYYPFKADGTYERDKVIDRLTADLAVAHERGPNSKIVWIMQGFAQGPPSDLRMPTADEMRDLAAIVYGTDVDGAMWYAWNFNDLYTDYLSKHPELHPVIRDIFFNIVQSPETISSGRRR